MVDTSRRRSLEDYDSTYFSAKKAMTDFTEIAENDCFR